MIFNFLPIKYIDSFLIFAGQLFAPSSPGQGSLGSLRGGRPAEMKDRAQLCLWLGSMNLPQPDPGGPPLCLPRRLPGDCRQRAEEGWTKRGGEALLPALCPVAGLRGGFREVGRSGRSLTAVQRLGMAILSFWRPKNSPKPGSTATGGGPGSSLAGWVGGAGKAVSGPRAAS